MLMYFAQVYGSVAWAPGGVQTYYPRIDRELNSQPDTALLGTSFLVASGLYSEATRDRREGGGEGW